MNWLTREKEIKLQILQSLADCQTSLSRILACVADAPLTGITADTAAELLNSAGNCQRAIGKLLSGVKLREMKAGRLAAPWINKAVRVATAAPPK
ncbi:MAG TPA: hypothetical protein VF260_09720 [Bacilli bacterium]